MKCHNIDYEILGDDLQVVEVELDPGESVIAEAGAMNYLNEGIRFDAKMGDGSDPNSGFFGDVFGATKRALGGESFFITHFTNQTGVKKKVAFSAPFPGKILALDLSQLNETLFAQRDAFLCAAKGTRISIAFNQRIGAGFFGGEGFILQKLVGDGMAFIHAGGMLVEKKLNNETLLVDTGCVVAFTHGIDFDIQRAGGLKSMFFGGEGLFLAALSGTGTVWLQSLPFSRLADRIIQSLPMGKKPHQGERSLFQWFSGR
ncbi:MAG: TIGR00266 family protein [Bdellovibrionales bacterium]|nr:TIGR00266 family protein [Bdellovibrionales bacterium]